MSQFFYIHPENPQARLINQAVGVKVVSLCIRQIQAMP